MSAEGECKAAEEVVPHACFDVLTLFAELVATLATERARDGQLALAEIHHILALIRGAGSPLLRAMAAQEGKCRHSFKPAVNYANSRQDVFRRLLVRPFETLLQEPDPAFPRRFLANYFEVIEVALGSRYKRYDQYAREVFHELLVRHGNQLAWDVFYVDVRARALLTRVLGRLMTYLETPAGQWAWVICMERVSGEGSRPTSAQTDLVLAALRATAAGLGLALEPMERPCLRRAGASS